MSCKSPLQIFRITTLFKDGQGHTEAQRGKGICPRLHSTVISALIHTPSPGAPGECEKAAPPPSTCTCQPPGGRVVTHRGAVWSSRTEPHRPAPAGCRCPRAGGAPRSPLATASAGSGNALGGPCIRLSPALAAAIELIWRVSGCSGRGTGVPGSLQPRPCAPGCRAGPSCHRAARTLPCRSCRRPPPTPISADSKSVQGSWPPKTQINYVAGGVGGPMPAWPGRERRGRLEVSVYCAARGCS